MIKLDSATATQCGRICAVEALWAIYPPTDQTKAEYQAYRAALARGVDEDAPAVSEPAELG
jgi:hypothetical protein